MSRLDEGGTRTVGDGFPAEAFDRETVDALLTTTRGVRRRLDLDRPVPVEVVQECLELAVHAPSADNTQHWRWIVVTDPERRAALARYYRWSYQLHGIASSDRRRRWADPGRHAANAESARWLADNLHRVPVLVVPCLLGEPPSDADFAALERAWTTTLDEVLGHGPVSEAPEASPRRTKAGVIKNCLYYGSIYPAVWSFQLALRSRGLGSVITSMHLPFEEEVAADLGIPAIVTQVCLLPVAYTVGSSFGPGPRRPAERVTYWNQWGNAEPLAAVGQRQGG